MKQHIKTFLKWLVCEERGNVMLLTTAAAIFATFGIYFFIAIREMSMQQKERITHLYNATVIAMSIDDHISKYLQTMPYPKNKLLHDGNPQYSSELLERIIGINDYDILSLEYLEENGFIVTQSDPTAKRILAQDISYDKEASKVKVLFKTTGDEVEDVYYLVNLAGTHYEENAPYSDNEPFFYLVSFNDDSGSGDYGDYDLSDNEITLIEGSTEHPFESILPLSKSAPEPVHTIVLPDTTE